MEQRCLVESVHRAVQDSAYELKRRLFPTSAQVPWRIEATL